MEKKFCVPAMTLSVIFYAVAMLIFVFNIWRNHDKEYRNEFKRRFRECHRIGTNIYNAACDHNLPINNSVIVIANDGPEIS
uniref:Uncharacterized protein n=1 Tax=Onchocerca volvulus TaxID=6282 RepID=A0A8R1U2A8_ONCVO